MEAGHVIPEAIQALLEKRGTFQDWLSRLDELGTDFRPEVAEKVRSDYRGRLTEVESELAGHRTELESALAERSEAVDQIAGRHDAHAAELEETELRHAVGEFDDEEWEKRRGEQQARLDELEADLTAQRSAVGSLQTVLGELTGGATAAASGAAAEAEVVAESEPPIPDELVATEDEWPEPGGDETLDVESADDLDAWMTQPLDEVEPGTEVEEAVEDVARAELVDADVVETDFADAEFVDAEVVDADAESAEAEKPEAPSETEPAADEREPAEFMDELEFLESLSLDEPDNFDAVSAMLDEDDGASGDDERRPVRGAPSVAEAANVASESRLATGRRLLRHDTLTSRRVQHGSDLPVRRFGIARRFRLQQALGPRADLRPDRLVAVPPLVGLSKPLAGALDVRQGSIPSVHVSRKSKDRIEYTGLCVESRSA
jgi:hypothetical protein